MSLVPQKQTGLSTNRLLRLRRAGWLHPVLIKGRWFYDEGELAAVPQLIDKASEILLGRDTNRRVGRPAYCELAAALATGGVMESVFFPTSFFDAPAVAPLTAEYKLLLGGAATHRRLLPCGVIFLTDYVFQSIGITSPAAGIHLADELQRRGIAVFDRDSRAFFNLYHFHWNLTGTQAGEGSAWDNAVTTSLAHVPPPLRSAVAQAMSIAPSKKISSPLCPTNLLSSLPAPGAGKKWVASELLVLLATYANPQQNDGGIFVVDFDALGAFCSLPAATVEQVLVTFNRDFPLARIERVAWREFSGQVE